MHTSCNKVSGTIERRKGSTNGGNGQFNYNDKYREYGYNFCFTRNKDFNYACKSSLKREIFTRDAVKCLKDWNPEATADWPSSYMPLVEEVMNVTSSMYKLMYRLLDGEHTMPNPDCFYAYKNARMKDAKNNWKIRNSYYRQQEMASSDIAISDDFDEDMHNDYEESPTNQRFDNTSQKKVLLHSTANDSRLARELSQTPDAQIVDASTMSENGNSDKAPADAGTKWDILLPKSKNGDQFSREYESLFGPAAKRTKEQDVGLADTDLDVYGCVSTFMEKYHDRKKRAYLQANFEQGMVEKMMNIDRAMKNTIWKQDMKKLITSNIMQVANDPDAMNLILEQNPAFFMKAFEMMATNDNVLKKIQTVEGFRPIWLTQMQVAIVNDEQSKRKKPSSNVNHASPMNPQEGMSSTIDQNNSQVAQHESSEDVPIANSYKFNKLNAKFGGYDLSAGGKKTKGGK